MLYHAQLLQSAKISEPIVVDGFETFEYSQFYPFHFNLGVGACSWFFYGFTDSPLRRKGRMTAGQKIRRADLERDLGRPDPKAIEDGIFQLVSYLGSKSGRLTIRSDEHPAYPRALRRVRQEAPDLHIDHERTLSIEARTFENPLFPVNLADLLIRHCHASHHRETIAFSKRRQAAIERLAILAVWRNMIKRRRENGDDETPAMKLGLTGQPLKWKDVFKRRLFPAGIQLPPPWSDYYWRKIKTPALGMRQGDHRMKMAA